MRTDPLERLKQLAPALPPSEAKVVAFILQDPTSACRMTINELADRCEISLATVIRVCKRSGFPGYRSFRQALTVAVVSDQSKRMDFGVSNGDIDLKDSAADVYRKIAFEEAQTIEDTITILDLPTIDLVVTAIDRASRIDVYGQGSSGLAAQDLQGKLNRIGYQSNAWSDPHLALMSAATLPQGAVAIGFSHSGQTAETIRALDVARDVGAISVAITNYPDAPIAAVADRLIVTASKETRLRYAAMSSRMAQFIIVDVLFMGVARLHPEQTHDLLAKTFAAVQTGMSARGRKGI